MMNARSSQIIGCVYLVLVSLFAANMAIGSEVEPDDESQAGSYKDRIYLSNGDRVTGSMKELDQGRLRVRTRTMDTVYLNWADIEGIETDKYLRIGLSDGSFEYGQLQRTDSRGDLLVVEAEHAVKISTSEIVSVRPLRVHDRLLARLEGDAKGGVDYTKGSDILKLNVASNLRLRRERYEIAVELSWNETARSEDNNSSRALLAGDYTRFLRDRWFWKGTSSFERNDETGVELRGLLGGSTGRYLVLTPRQRFEVNAGLAATNEIRTGNASDQSSLEGMLRTSYDLFIYRVPKTRLSAGLSLFPGITETGRLRGNANISLRNEIIEDLFWDLSFYTTYDNQPPEGG